MTIHRIKGCLQIKLEVYKNGVSIWSFGTSTCFIVNKALINDSDLI